MLRTLFTAAAALAASVSVGQAAVVFTEGFENPDIGRSWYVYDEFGQFVTVEGAGIEIQRSGTVVNAYEGNQYVELDSHKGLSGRDTSEPTNTAMAALLEGLKVGFEYEVSFAYHPRTNGADDNGIKVAIGNLFIDTLTSPDTRTFTENHDLGTVNRKRNDGLGWMVVTYSFIATAADNAIYFAATGTENTLGGFIDDVSVSETPVPAAGLLLLSGIAGLAGLRGRKRAA